MNSKGYVLIELLVASILLSLAGAGLHQGLMGGVRAEQTMRNTDRVYNPLRSFWRRIEKDLRNSVSLRDQRFAGKETELVFPIVQTVEQTLSPKKYELHQIRYFIKNRMLIRSDQIITNKLVKPEAHERKILEGFETIRFEYAYLEEGDKAMFRPFWLEEPYFGIPKAVNVEVKMDGASFSKVISIPQGEWGHIERGADSV